MKRLEIASSLQAFRATTADGEALREVALILLHTEAASDYVRAGIFGYLKSRYRQPIHILTPDDIENYGAASESLK